MIAQKTDNSYLPKKPAPSLMTWTVASFFICCSLASVNCEPRVGNNLEPFEDPIATTAMDFSGPGRIHYQTTGPTWNDDNILIEDRLWELSDSDQVSPGTLDAARSEMAVYCSGATPVITVHPSWQKQSAPQPGTYTFSGVLITEEIRIPLFFAQGELEIKGDSYLPVEIWTDPLAAHTAGLFDLEIEHTYQLSGPVSNQPLSRISRHRFAQTWRCPLPGTPLYKQIIEWGCAWIQGYHDDQGEITENTLAAQLLEAMGKLSEQGYRYGPFGRPDNPPDRAEVFLDFKQSACGEFRGFFMALLETQGIDANWLWFWFSEPSSQRYSMYQTREIAALGTDSQIWRYSDHIVVEVNGVVYDPTYLVTRPDADTYEDFMFASFCYGEDRHCQHANDWCTIPGGPHGICIVNPQGFSEAVGPNRFRGEDYH